MRFRVWVASARAFAEKHRVAAYGAALVLALGVVANATGLVSFFGSESERERLRRIEERLDTFAMQHGIERVREGLDLNALSECFEWGWALFFVDVAGRLTYVPVEGLRPATGSTKSRSTSFGDKSIQVDWSTAVVIENRETEVEIQVPAVRISEGNSLVTSGTSRFIDKKSVGYGGSVVLMGVFALENRVLSHDRGGSAILMGARREPALPVCSMLPPVADTSS